MTAGRYENLLQPERSGAYRAPDSLAELRAAAARAGLAWFELDSAGARDKVAFLAACARDLGFPAWFGANWDALSDCLKDFSWARAPGYVIVWRGAAALGAAAPELRATALEIFRDAASYWQERGAPFLVLLEPGAAAGDLPPLGGGT